MKLLTEYLERAAHFQTLAEAATIPRLKYRLQDQAMAYFKFAGRRARELRTLPPRLPLFESFWGPGA